MSDPEKNETQAEQTTTLSIARANALALALTPVLIFFLGVPYGLIHGFEGLIQPFADFTNYLLFLPVFLMSIILHEGLHGLGFIFFSEASTQDVKYGIKWEALTPYAHCEIPVRAYSYRIAVLMPTIILGVMPYFVGLLTASPRWAIYGTIMILAGLGDLLALWAIRHVPGEAQVQDHPSEVGCEVIGDQA